MKIILFLQALLITGLQTFAQCPDSTEEETPITMPMFDRFYIYETLLHGTHYIIIKESDYKMKQPPAVEVDEMITDTPYIVIHDNSYYNDSTANALFLSNVKKYGEDIRQKLLIKVGLHSKKDSALYERYRLFYWSKEGYSRKRIKSGKYFTREQFHTSVKKNELLLVFELMDHHDLARTKFNIVEFIAKNWGYYPQQTKEYVDSFDYSYWQIFVSSK